MLNLTGQFCNWRKLNGPALWQGFRLVAVCLFCWLVGFIFLFFLGGGEWFVFCLFVFFNDFSITVVTSNRSGLLILLLDLIYCELSGSSKHFSAINSERSGSLLCFFSLI